ncbi:MAG: hypothetical protein ACT4QA_10365 [Panacagrimonas sp.]
MSQEQFAQHGKPHKTFEQRSDTVLWISLGVGFALMGALGVANWASNASAGKAAVKPTDSVQAKTSSVDPVYQCNGHVSFKPCS